MDFHLLHPQAFWLLLVLPAVIFMIWRRVRSSASWSRVIDPHLLPHLMTGTGETRTSRNHWWTVIWLALGTTRTAPQAPLFCMASDRRFGMYRASALRTSG